MYANTFELARGEIRAAVEAAARAAGLFAGEPVPDFSVDRPKDRSHGDFAANFAMRWAKSCHMAPRALAEAVCARLALSGTHIERTEIAGPGFVNFFLSQNWYGDTVRAILAAGADYGKSDGGQGRKVMVEFVSANPTGPMHLGNARGGVLGDSLAELFTWCGWQTEREFYVNDTGNQIAILFDSIMARYTQLLRGEDACVFPENGYHGDDVKELAAALAEAHGERYLTLPREEAFPEITRFALDRNISRMRGDLERYRIRYDTWFFESSLHESGYVQDTLLKLQAAGCLYEKDGALWFRATDFGCEKDEVMKKSNGFFTYYAVDIAYHRNKFEKRGFDRVVDVFGADHHGHKVRFAAGLSAMGIDPARLEIVLMQLVSLMQDGEQVRMSKRTGKMITLSNLLDEISVDAARFFFNSRQPDTHLEFDLSLAVREDSDNPVYYVQYAHARICSILAILAKEGYAVDADCDLAPLTAPEEQELIAHLAAFPDELIAALAAYDPSRVVQYTIRAAALFHKFYTACHVRGEAEPVLRARLALCAAAARVIENAFLILGVSAPEKM